MRGSAPEWMITTPLLRLDRQHSFSYFPSLQLMTRLGDAECCCKWWSSDLHPDSPTSKGSPFTSHCSPCVEGPMVPVSPATLSQLSCVPSCVFSLSTWSLASLVPLWGRPSPAELSYHYCQSHPLRSLPPWARCSQAAGTLVGWTNYFTLLERCSTLCWLLPVFSPPFDHLPKSWDLRHLSVSPISFLPILACFFQSLCTSYYLPDSLLKIQFILNFIF